VKKILIVEDDKATQSIYAGLLNGSAEILQATTISEAGILLADNHEDVALMVFDGNVPWKPGDKSGTTVSLIAGIRAGCICDKKFTGPMIATSFSRQLLAEQVAAGCDYACPKEAVTDLVKLLLGKLG
jgi:CheY-like chemotaxis protein